MALTRVTYVAYRTRNFTAAQAEYDAYKVIQAFKGREVKGYAWVPVGDGKRFKLEDSTKASVFPWFGTLAAAELTRRFAGMDIALVPIPHSECIIGTDAAKTARLAHQIARHNASRFSVWDGLRWLEANTPSSQGGSREAGELFGNLIAVDALPKRQCVLVDDVTTSGGHFRAAEALMRRDGAAVALAMAVGQTVHDKVTNYFGWVEGVLPLYEPKLG